MQKNNCKLKTIFKKGLSFSIALALGAAATSLNLAKTAEAALDFANARKAYLAGENLDISTIATVTHYSTDGTNWTPKGTALKLTSDMTKVGVATAEAGTGKEDYNFKVYDWAKIYNATNVKVAHNVVHDNARKAIVDSLVLNVTNGEHITAIKKALGAGELQLTNGTKITNVNYTEHNGKEVQIKLDGCDVVCKLGKLEVTRAVKKIELATKPEEYFYIAGEKINLDGLTLNVTYEVGDPAIVAWTEATKGEFVLEGGLGRVENGADITADIKDIKITYGGQILDKAFDLYLGANAEAVAKGIATVNGVFAGTPSLAAVSLPEENDNYKKLKAAFSNEDAKIIFAYELSLTGAESFEAKNVNLTVGKLYAGQVVTVKHLLDDGSIETFVTTVDTDGIVTVKVDSLSPFMVALGATEEDKTAAAETEKKNEEAAKTEAAKTEAAKASAASTASANKSTTSSASKSVKTGDVSVVAFSVFGFIALISAAVLLYMKKNRKSIVE